MCFTHHKRIQWSTFRMQCHYSRAALGLGWVMFASPSTQKRVYNARIAVCYTLTYINNIYRYTQSTQQLRAFIARQRGLAVMQPEYSFWCKRLAINFYVAQELVKNTLQNGIGWSGRYTLLWYICFQRAIQFPVHTFICCYWREYVPWCVMGYL